MPDDDAIFIGGLGQADAADASTALRERAADALEAALAFVDRHGDERARLRARAHLEAIPVAEAASAVFETQRPDGSFERQGFVLAGSLEDELDASGIAAPLRGTLEALAALADLRSLADARIERTVEWLAREQRADGSFGWEEGAEEGADGGVDGGVDGGADARLFATGMLAGHAARTPFVRPALLQAAAGFLASLWSPERIERGRFSALAAFAHFYSNAPRSGDEETDLADAALQWCGRELERDFRTRRHDASQTLRILLYCDVAALPGSDLSAPELLERLLEEQAGDGGFQALDPREAPGRVGPSVDALLAIPALCRAL